MLITQQHRDTNTPSLRNSGRGTTWRSWMITNSMTQQQKILVAQTLKLLQPTLGVAVSVEIQDRVEEDTAGIRAYLTGERHCWGQISWQGDWLSIKIESKNVFWKRIQELWIYINSYNLIIQRANDELLSFYKIYTTVRVIVFCVCNIFNVLMFKCYAICSLPTMIP